MNWILENWILLLLIGGMLVMHLFGHRHGPRKPRDDDETKDDARASKAPDKR